MQADAAYDFGVGSKLRRFTKATPAMKRERSRDDHDLACGGSSRSISVTSESLKPDGKRLGAAG